MDPLIVVSGFPRTGTSTMMRMLSLGGLEVIADKQNLKGSNEFAPYGDFELMGKQLSEIKELDPNVTSGKAVKIVSPFLRSCCPIDRPVKAIFMLRDVNEIVASLLAMKVVWEWIPSESIADALRFLDEHEIPSRFVQYSDMLNYPHTTASGVAEWLGIKMDADDMTKAVDRNVRDGVKPEIVTYQFTKALVDDTHVVDLKGGKQT